MALASRALIAALLILGVSLAGLVMMVYRQVADVFHRQERTQLENIVLQVTNRLDRSAHLALTAADIIAHFEPVQTALRTGNRDALLALTHDAYVGLAAQSGVMNGHFHTADLRSFLRVQKPEQFGEYLGNDRPMIVAANRQRHSMAGLETGTTGIGIRGVVPVGAGDQFAGTFDISLDLSSLLGPLKTDTNADFGIFIDMKVMPDEATKAGDPSTAAHVYGDLRGEDATNWDVIGELARRSATFVTKEPRFGTAKISGNHYSFVAMPLLDFSGRTIGTIVGALNLQAEHVVLSRLTTRLIAAALLMFIIVGGAFSVILHGFALRPLHTAADAACRLADGDAMGDLPIPTRRDGVWRLLHALHTISLRLPSSSADSTTTSRGVRS